MTADSKIMEGLASGESASAGDFWLRLDNAAKIYPAIQSEEMTAVFRLSVVLKERIKIKPFLKAVALLEEHTSSAVQLLVSRLKEFSSFSCHV